VKRGGQAFAVAQVAGVFDQFERRRNVSNVRARFDQWWLWITTLLWKWTAVFAGGRRTTLFTSRWTPRIVPINSCVGKSVVANRTCCKKTMTFSGCGCDQAWTVNTFSKRPVKKRPVHYLDCTILPQYCSVSLRDGTAS
jgi:hypothetical protein